jgi:hypothetical protein
MHVVKTNSERGTFHSGQEFIRVNSDNFENLHHTNDEIKAGLFGELGDEFKLWAEVIITTPSQQDKIRYENFIMGYFYRHDQLKDDQGNKEPDHSVYFKWDIRQGNLLGRIFVYPLLVENVSTMDPELAKSLVADAAADASDPPGTNTPPPPLDGIGSGGSA